MASPIVSFRLDPAQHRRLLARAGTRGANAFARELTLRALEEDTLAGRFEDHLGQTGENIDRLRGDLSIAMQALLVWLGKMPPEEAKRWADEHLS